MKWVLQAAFFLLSINVSAQEYGKILQEEIKLKECSFDKNAEAVILLDKAVTAADDERQLITKRRIKIKILKPSGADRGDVRISFYSKDDFERLTDIEAYVYNETSEGVPKTTVIDRRAIFTQKVNELYSETKIVMPEVKVGSIIEYRFTRIRRSVYGIRDWLFQTDIPTIYSHYDLTIPPGIAFAYKVIKSAGLNVDVKSNKDEGRVIFEMKNIAGLREEPFMDAPHDYLQRVVFQVAEYQTQYGGKKKYANSWPELGIELSNQDYFGRAIDKNIKGSGELLAAAKALPNDYDKMALVYSYIRKNFNWNGIYSYLTEEGLNRVWDKKAGNAAEINLVLVNLLKELKLDAYPLLASARNYGKVDASYPFVDQFGQVAVMVTINGQRYILDAMDKTTPVGIVPFNLLNTNAFVVAKKSSAIIFIKEDVRMSKDFYGIETVINEDGKLSGNVNVLSYDYTRLDKVDDYKTKYKLDKFISKYYRREVSNLSIDNFEVKNLDADSLPLDQSFKFTSNLTASGDYALFNLNLFGAIEKTPFVSDNRFTDINYGCQVLESIAQVIRLPKNMTPDVLPKNINLVMPDNSITLSRIISYDAASHTVHCRIKWQVTRTVFKPEEYISVKDFYKKMVDLLNEPLVLKKK